MTFMACFSFIAGLGRLPEQLCLQIPCSWCAPSSTWRVAGEKPTTTTMWICWVYNSFVRSQIPLPVLQWQVVPREVVKCQTTEVLPKIGITQHEKYRWSLSLDRCQHEWIIIAFKIWALYFPLYLVRGQWLTSTETEPQQGDEFVLWNSAFVVGSCDKLVPLNSAHVIRGVEDQAICWELPHSTYAYS